MDPTHISLFDLAKKWPQGMVRPQSRRAVAGARASIPALQPRDHALVRPIRVVANAIADGVPHRDLLVSPDHALLVDGKFIPARLLRNGATIHKELANRSVTSCHMERENHDIPLLEGLPAGNYFDAGAGAACDNVGLPVLLPPDFGRITNRTRSETGSCIPLVIDAAHVEPVWRALARRAEQLGFSLPSFETTDDPALCIVAGERRIEPVVREGKKYIFVLPSIGTAAWLVSRSTTPSLLSPWLEDRRTTGVMVRQIVVRCGGEDTVIAADDVRLLDGWWASERDPTTIWRWTNGNARLPTEGGRAIVEVLIGDTQSYPLGDRAGYDQPAAASGLCA